MQQGFNEEYRTSLAQVDVLRLSKGMDRNEGVSLLLVDNLTWRSACLRSRPRWLERKSCLLTGRCRMEIFEAQSLQELRGLEVVSRYRYGVPSNLGGSARK